MLRAGLLLLLAAVLVQGDRARKLRAADGDDDEATDDDGSKQGAGKLTMLDDGSVLVPTPSTKTADEDHDGHGDDWYKKQLETRHHRHKKPLAKTNCAALTSIKDCDRNPACAATATGCHVRHQELEAERLKEGKAAEGDDDDDKEFITSAPTPAPTPPTPPPTPHHTSIEEVITDVPHEKAVPTPHPTMKRGFSLDALDDDVAEAKLKKVYTYHPTPAPEDAGKLADEAKRAQAERAQKLKFYIYRVHHKGAKHLPGALPTPKPTPSGPTPKPTPPVWAGIAHKLEKDAKEQAKLARARAETVARGAALLAAAWTKHPKKHQHPNSLYAHLDPKLMKDAYETNIDADASLTADQKTYRKVAHHRAHQEGYDQTMFPTPAPLPTPAPVRVLEHPWAAAAGDAYTCTSTGNVFVSDCTKYNDEDLCLGWDSPLPRESQACDWVVAGTHVQNAATAAPTDKGQTPASGHDDDDDVEQKEPGEANYHPKEKFAAATTTSMTTAAPAATAAAAAASLPPSALAKSRWPSFAASTKFATGNDAELAGKESASMKAAEMAGKAIMEDFAKRNRAGKTL